MSTPLKVLFASHGDSLNGGAERSLLEITAALRDDGRVAPTVAVPAEGALSRALDGLGVPTRVVPTPLWTPFDPAPFAASTFAGRARKRARTAARTVRYAATAWRSAIAQEQPAVVVTNTVAIASPALGAALLGVPHVWWVREFAGTGHPLQFPLGDAVSRRLIDALSTRVVANSQAVLRHYAPPVAKEKTRVIHPTVTMPPAQPRVPSRSDLRLLVLGTQYPDKGGWLAIEAMARLRDVPDLSLRLVGWIAPDAEEELVALAARLGVSDRVEIVGGTDDPADELIGADVLLMCSRREPFGRVTAEALRCGTPVIGFRSGGTPEIVTDEVDGLLVEPGSVDDLVRAVRRVAADRALLGRLGAEAVLRSRGRFTIEDATSRAVQTLSEAARARRYRASGRPSTVRHPASSWGESG